MKLRQFIIENLSKSPYILPPQYSFDSAIDLIINGAIIANWGSRAKAKFIATVPALAPLDKGSTYKNRFVKFYGRFHCTKCDNVLDLEKAVSGRFNICKLCDATKSKIYRENNQESCRQKSKLHYESNKSYYFAKNAKARAAKLNATPKWSNDVNILAIYEECPLDHHVDHIIPLQGRLISGLHVEENLQYLTATDNISKSNKVDLELESKNQLAISQSKMKLYYNTHIV